MPLQAHMKIISVDDHIIEPPTLWQDRLPARWKDAGPKSVRTPEGNDEWEYEGRRYPNIAIGAAVGRPLERRGYDPVSYDDMLPGCYDPVARLADMDTDGVWASLGFPSFARFAGTLFAIEGRDKTLAHLCVQAYNDFVLDEWCAAARDRFIPLVILPLWDVGLAVAEVERCAANGAKAISFVENPSPLGYPSWHTSHWDPVFAAAQDAGLPLCMHFGSSGTTPRAWMAPSMFSFTSDDEPSGTGMRAVPVAGGGALSPIVSADAPPLVGISLVSLSTQVTLADLLFSDKLHKFPRTKIVLSEGGIGWLPYLLERIDYSWERQRQWDPRVNQETVPSELFRRNIFGCFIDDETGVRIRDTIGVENIMIECDYPHSDSNFPATRKRVSELLGGVPDDEVHQIVELNARAVFNFAT